MSLPSRAYVSVNEAATIIGISDAYVRQLLISETIRGIKLNERAWAVEKKSAEKFAETTAKTGRPRKGA